MITDEERQKIIVRQSSIKSAIEYCKVNNIQMNLENTLKVSEIMTFYVIKGFTTSVIKNIKLIDKTFKDEKEI